MRRKSYATLDHAAQGQKLRIHPAKKQSAFFHGDEGRPVLNQINRQ
jgi:hypothetical protein